MRLYRNCVAHWHPGRRIMLGARSARDQRLPGNDLALSCDTFLSMRAALIKIATGDQRSNFAIRDGALQHPESAIRIHVFDAVLAEHGFRLFEAARDRVGRFNLSRFDIDHA